MSQAKTIKAIDTEIGVKIHQLRVSSGVSRQELAAKIGITHQQLQKYEKGINRISASRLLDISHHLNASIQYFFEDVMASVPPEALERQRFYVDLMRDFAQIGHKGQQEAIRKLVHAIANEQG